MHNKSVLDTCDTFGNNNHVYIKTLKQNLKRTGKNMEKFTEKNVYVTLENKCYIVLIFFQSKLNCEVLYDDLAFEVRWAVAGESIVVQLVAKLGTMVNDYWS